MNKALILASLLLVVMTLAGAPSAMSQARSSDLVAGVADECLSFLEPEPGQVFCDRRLVVDVDVESGPTGGDPSGTVNWQDLGPTPGGTSYSFTQATCLMVDGRVAVIGVTGTRERFGGEPAVFPIAGLVRIVDGGGPNSGGDIVQFAIEMGAEDGPTLPGPTTCSTFPGPFPTGSFLFPTFTNETGDIVVIDTRPMPTSKEQCKHGGWKTYGVFQNQGDCVSFVATKGKNPPANTSG